MSGFNTYGACFTGLNAGTSATTIIAELICTGLAQIQLLYVSVSGTEATAAASIPCLLIKESTNSTGGTKTAATSTPFTTLNTTAATATLNGYTVAPTAGTLVGVLGSKALVLGLGAAAVGPNIVEFNFQLLAQGTVGQPPALNLVGEAFAITLNNTTPANAPALDITVWWQEVPLLT
jgi:hypothetical protein